MTFEIPVPGPSEAFTTVEVGPEDVAIWYHVYCTREHPNRADTFSEGWGNTRFAPIVREDGTPVHTYYAASTVECALMESVLHDMPLSPPGVFDVDDLQYFRLAQFTLSQPLSCVSFHTPYLPALQNITRAHLVDSLPAFYPQTRAWAQAAYLQRPGAQAIAYGSRRDDSGRCLMLFKHRMPDQPFMIVGDEPLALSPRRQQVRALVRRLGIREI